MNRTVPFEKARHSLKAAFGGYLTMNDFVRRIVIMAAVFVALVVILSADLIPKRVQIEVGQPSKETIEAPRDVINRAVTGKLQDGAARQAVKEASLDPNNYDISQAASVNAEDTMDMIFKRIRDLHLKMGGDIEKAAEIEGESAELAREIETGFGISLTRKIVGVLLRQEVDVLDELKDKAGFIVGTIMKDVRISKDTLGLARERARGEVDGLRIPKDLIPAVKEIVGAVLSPNLVLNPGKVEKVREAAIRAVEPVLILKGQTIIRRGDIATPEHIAILEDLGLLGSRFNYLALLGIILLVLLLFGIAGMYLYQYNRLVLLNTRLLALYGSLIVLLCFIAAVVSSVPWPYASYLVPISLGTMLVAILLDSRLAVITSVMLGILAGIMADSALKLSIISTITGIVGVFSVSRVAERSDLVRAGAIVGAANALVMVAVGPITGDVGLVKISYLGLINGILSTVFTIGFLPFFENLFHITSSIRLLELSNPNQPLLKRLLIEAPGTYHHSIIVGNLAEAAADAIGGEGLLVRVGAYYHDIGKIKRPYFFVENQLMQDNPHDKISPHLSTLVVTSHVRDGVDLARAYRLPDSIVDIVHQHHGTDLVRYFYQRATENGKENSVTEEDFRYPGPKPKTAEAAIVMLADSVEAGVRSLTRPTPGRIEGLVRKIIKDRLADGQFDECDLTLKDLDGVASAFVRVLSGIFHARVEYPDIVTRDFGQRVTS